MRKFKRLLCGLLAMALLVCALPAAMAEGADKTTPGYVDENNGHPKYVSETFDFVEGDIAYKLVDGGVEVAPWKWAWKGHNCPQHTDHVFAGSEYSNRGTMSIPASVSHGGQSYAVVGIGSGAFFEVGGTSVTLPEGLQYLADSAFSASNLTDITIPASVTRIGERSLASGFASITFAPGSNLQTVGSLAFDGAGVTQLALPETVTEIGARAFRGCGKLAAVTIPAGARFTSLPAFGNSSFDKFNYQGEVTFALGSPYYERDGVVYDGDALLEVRRVQEHVVVPEGVKYITEGAFWMPNKDSTLKTLQLPQSLVSIGKNAFAGNTGLQSVVVPENVTEIGTQAFNGCSAMTSAVVEGNVTELNGTFGGCSALASVTLPDTVKVIGSSTFSGCASLTEFDFSGIEEIGSRAFFNSGVKVLEGADSLRIIGNTAFANSKLEKPILPQGVTELPQGVFGNCEALKTVVLPDTVTVIQKQAFQKALAQPGSILIMQGNVPPSFDANAFGSSGKPDADVLTVIVPQEAKDAYAADSTLGSYVSVDASGITYALSLDKAALSVQAGGTAVLKADAVLPAGAGLVWASSSPAVATVENGTVKGAAAGTAVVTARIELNGVVLADASCTVTVTKAGEAEKPAGPSGGAAPAPQKPNPKTGV